MMIVFLIFILNIFCIYIFAKIQKRLWNQNGAPQNHKLFDAPTTQNLKILFEENSCFYIFTRQSFDKNCNRIGNKAKMINISQTESFDLDNSLITSINTKELTQRMSSYIARRPKHSGLETLKIEDEIGLSTYSTDYGLTMLKDSFITA